MTSILAYTSPALGHLLPISALLSELSQRGHTIHIRTFSGGVDVAQRLGFVSDAIDPRIEAIEMDDWKGNNPIAALKLSVSAFSRRAIHEMDDLADAMSRVRPDALIVDVNCWGALSVCVVPYQRDQFEVARRVEVAGCGTRLAARRLSPARLRTRIRQAMAMTDGARRVAEGFRATGGVGRGANLVEHQVLGSSPTG